MHIPTRKNSVWCDTTIYGIISNETYAGIWHYGKKGKSGKNPKENHIPVNVEPIVSREVWEAAQERLVYNKQHARRNRKRLYLFANRVTCSCGYKMSGTGNTGNYCYYRCPTKTNDEMKTRRECHNSGFSVSIVDARIWDKIEEAARDRDRLIEGLKGYRTQQENKIEPIRRKLAHVEQLIVDKNTERESAYLDQKLLTSERAKARKAIEINQLEQTIDALVHGGINKDTVSIELTEVKA